MSEEEEEGKLVCLARTHAAFIWFLILCLFVLLQGLSVTRSAGFSDA